MPAMYLTAMGTFHECTFHRPAWLYPNVASTVYTGSGVGRAKGTTWTFPALPSCYECHPLCAVGAHLWSRLVMRLLSQLPASVWAKPGHWTEAFIALKELKDELGRKGWNGSRERAVMVLGVES